MKASLVQSEKNQIVYQLTGCEEADLDQKIGSFFFSEGYRPGPFQGEIKTYTKGDKTMRVLLGALVDYYKQKVMIREEGTTLSLTFFKDFGGISGGLIGRNKAKKEFFRLNEALKIYLNAAPELKNQGDLI